MKRKGGIFLTSVLALFSALAPSVWAAEYAGYQAKSNNPLRCMASLGGGEKSPQMLMLLDESKGTGTGYDLLLADLNLNGKLGDEKPTSPTLQQARQSVYRVSVEAPFRDVSPKATYTFNLNLYSQSTTTSTINLYAQGLSLPAPSLSIIGYIDLKKDAEAWQYMFICHPTVDKQDAGLKRLRLGTPVTLETSAQKTNIPSTKSQVATLLWGGSVVQQTVPGISVSAMLRDADGQVLRLARKGVQTVSPHLLVKSSSGKSVEEKDMEYG